MDTELKFAELDIAIQRDGQHMILAYLPCLHLYYHTMHIHITIHITMHTLVSNDILLVHIFLVLFVKMNIYYC